MICETDSCFISAFCIVDISLPFCYHIGRKEKINFFQKGVTNSKIRRHIR